MSVSLAYSEKQPIQHTFLFANMKISSAHPPGLDLHLTFTTNVALNQPKCVMLRSQQDMKEDQVLEAFGAIFVPKERY